MQAISLIRERDGVRLQADVVFPEPYERVRPEAFVRFWDNQAVGYTQFAINVPAPGDHSAARMAALSHVSKMVAEGWSRATRRAESALARTDKPAVRVVSSSLNLAEGSVVVGSLSVVLDVDDDAEWQQAMNAGHPIFVGRGGNIPIAELGRLTYMVISNLETRPSPSSEYAYRMTMLLHRVSGPGTGGAARAVDPVEIWVRGLSARPRPLVYEQLWTELARLVPDSRRRAAILTQVMRDEVEIGVSEQERVDRIRALDEAARAARSDEAARQAAKRADVRRPQRQIDLE